MIDFDINEHDRLACRDAIARALDARSPELALEALERFGEPLREALYEWPAQTDDDDDCGPDEDINGDMAAAITEALGCLEEAQSALSKFA